jgi:flavocytochrome c
MSQEWSNAVIIVGSGLSGSSAALTALEAGAKVIVVEKEKKLGGNSVRASSGINASETHHQKKQNIKDSNELFARDTAYSKDKDRNAIPTELIWTLCNNSAAGVKWLEDHDLSLPVLSQCGGHSASRTHRPVTGAAGGYITLGLVKHVRKYEEKGQCKIIKQAKLSDLLKDKNGRVVGIEYENLANGNKVKLTGSAVVIATGGFLYNNQMLKEYCPQVAMLPTTNGPWTTGDGMQIAKKSGAGLVDMREVQVHPTGFVDTTKPDDREKTLAAECLRAAGALLINKDGHRFVNELGHRDDVTAAERSQKGLIRLILNPIAVSECEPHTRMYRDFFKVLKIYKNAQALADDMKIPVENLIDTFETYNNSARKGWCPSGKDRFPGYPYKADQELHVGFVVPVLHYVMGGIKIDPNANVLTPEGKIIPGLFACGETTGGIHGRNRLAGNSLVDCVVYGRIAGKSAYSFGSSQLKSKL